MARLHAVKAAGRSPIRPWESPRNSHRSGSSAPGGRTDRAFERQSIHKTRSPSWWARTARWRSCSAAVAPRVSRSAGVRIRAKKSRIVSCTSMLSSPDFQEALGLRAGTHERRDIIRIESPEVDLVDHAANQHISSVVERKLAACQHEHPQVRGLCEDFPEERKEGEHLRRGLVGVVEHDEAPRPGQLAPQDIVDSAGLSPAEDGSQTGSARGGEELGERREDRLPCVPRSDAVPEQAPSPAQVVAGFRGQVRLADARDTADYKHPGLDTGCRETRQLVVAADEPRAWG